MSYGAMACNAWTITEEDLAKIVPEAFAKFKEALGAVTVDNFCRNTDCVCDVDGEEIAEEHSEAIDAAWVCLCETFEAATTIEGAGLMITAGYVGEDGSPYDDVSGPIFMVEGVQILTPAAKALQGVLHNSFWVEYG